MNGKPNEWRVFSGNVVFHHELELLGGRLHFAIQDSLQINAEFGGIPDLTVLDDGTVYLADYFNDRVLKLKLGE